MKQGKTKKSRSSKPKKKQIRIDRKSEAARKLELEFYRMWVGDYYYKR